MNATNNIFDMFLGIGDPLPTLPQVGGNPSEVTGEQPFAALFGSILGGGQIGERIVPAGLLNLQQSPGDVLPGTESLQTPETSATPRPETVLPDGLLKVGPATEELTKFEIAGPGLLNNEATANTRTAMRPTLMTQSAEISLEQLPGGRYDVAEATITDGKLNILFENNQSEDAVEIRLSLPLEDMPAELQTGSEQRIKVPHGKVGVPARVALNDPGVSLAHLSEYASGLNLKAVEIDLTKVNQQTASDEPTIDIKLFVEQQGREVIFRQLVPADKISLTESRKRLYHPATVNAEQSTLPEISGKADQAKAQAETGQERLPFRTAPRTITAGSGSTTGEFIELFKTAEKSDQMPHSETKADSRSWTEAGVDRTQSSTNSSETAQTSRPVRFSLPDGVDRVLEPGTRGIMIRIEPDNIGPARLNLSFRGDGLVARVTVESAAVRTMVEGSLNQLADQLQKAGIKVDHLEVGVGSGHEQQSQFGGHPRWDRPVRRGSFAPYMDKSEESNLVTSNLPPRHYAQVGPNGVNLYA